MLNGLGIMLKGMGIDPEALAKVGGDMAERLTKLEAAVERIEQGVKLICEAMQLMADDVYNLRNPPPPAANERHIELVTYQERENHG